MRQDEFNLRTCTAGNTYAYAVSDGRVYRCKCFSGDALTEVGNPDTSWVIPAGNFLPCPCHPANCWGTDRYFTFQQQNGILISNCGAGVTSDNLVLVAQLTEACDMNCCYCLQDHSNQFSLPGSTWISWWEMVDEKLRSQKRNLVINLYGGEPLVYPDINQILTWVIETQTQCWISTNLHDSSKIDFLLNFGRSPKKLTVCASLHFGQTGFNLDETCDRLLCLKLNGYRCKVTLLDWPPNRKFFQKAITWAQYFGIPYQIIPWFQTTPRSSSSFQALD